MNYKSEVKKTLFQLVVLILSGLFAFWLPIATHCFKIGSEKVLTTIDFGIFNAIFTLLGIFFRWIYTKFLMIVSIHLEAADQETKKLYLSDSDVEKQKQHDVVLHIKITGKKKKFKKLLRVRCPESYLFQLSKSSYSFVKEIKNSEEYEIDLEKLLSRNSGKEVNLSRDVHFSLLLEEHNAGSKDEIKVENKTNYWFGFISFQSDGLKLIQK